MPESLLCDRQGQQQCPLRDCLVWIQRTPDGSLADGLRLHLEQVHGGAA